MSALGNKCYKNQEKQKKDGRTDETKAKMETAKEYREDELHEH
jgi:hypothetical protein